MSHKQTTYTVVAGFALGGPEWSRKAHTLAVRATAYWASEWWKHEAADHPLYENVGFTVHESHGGGAGWPVERGVTVMLAGLTLDHAPGVVRFAQALKAREEQEAVVLTSRVERFDLV
jgi:hypothetical protein